MWDVGGTADFLVSFAWILGEVSGSWVLIVVRRIVAFREICSLIVVRR